jgi:hypothetical protein
LPTADRDAQEVYLQAGIIRYLSHMALLFLFIAFFFTLYGGWHFFHGYFTAATPNEQWLVATTGVALVVIPYIIAKVLSEMVAIRQRQVTLEQLAQQNFLLNQQLSLLQTQVRSMQNAQQRNAPAVDFPETGE